MYYNKFIHIHYNTFVEKNKELLENFLFLFADEVVVKTKYR